MIYPQSNVAAMIAGRLTTAMVQYGVTKIASGFSVAPVVEPETAPSFTIQSTNAGIPTIVRFIRRASRKQGTMTATLADCHILGRLTLS